MTEQHSSFGGVAVADPRSTTTSPLDLGTEAEGADNRRKLALVGAVVAVLVVLVAAFFMLKGNGGGSTATLPPHVVPPAAGSTAQSGTAAKGPKAIQLPKSYGGAVGRDPFKPLYVQPAAQPAGATNATTGPTTGTTGSAATPANPPLVNTLSAPSPVWVELVRVVNNKSATFVVAFNNGSSLKTHRYTNVKVPTGSSAPTVFGNVFGLVKLSNGHAVVQYGDGTPITLMPGPGNRLVVS